MAYQYKFGVRADHHNHREAGWITMTGSAISAWGWRASARHPAGERKGARAVDEFAEGGDEGALMVSVGDRVSLAVAHGAHAPGTIVAMSCDGQRVTVRLDANANVVYDVGVSALEALATAG